MGKRLMLLAAMALLTAGQIGCRACGTCYDYSSPLARGGCNTCDAGATGACSTCDGGSSYYDGEIVVE